MLDDPYPGASTMINNIVRIKKVFLSGGESVTPIYEWTYFRHDKRWLCKFSDNNVFLIKEV